MFTVSTAKDVKPRPLIRLIDNVSNALVMWYSLSLSPARVHTRTRTRTSTP